MSDVIFVSHDVLIDTDLIATEMLNSFGFFIHNLSLITCAFYICGKTHPQEKNSSFWKKTLSLTVSLILIRFHFRYGSHQRVLGKGRMQFSQTSSLLRLASWSGWSCWWIRQSPQVEPSPEQRMLHRYEETTSKSIEQRPSLLQPAVFPHHEAWGVLLHEHAQ